MRKVYKVTLLFLIILIGVNTFKFYLHHRELEKVYSNSCKVYNGMKLQELYDLFNSQVKPRTSIEFKRRDTSYRHTIYYPPRFGDEDYISFEYDPLTSRIINYPTAITCPE